MIQQTKKLRLDELNVESFVTTNVSEETKGGTFATGAGDATACGSIFLLWMCGPTPIGTASGQLITCATCGYVQGCTGGGDNGSGPNPPQTIPGVDCPPEFNTQTVQGYDYTC